MADCNYSDCSQWKATCEVCAKMDEHFCIDHEANMTQIGTKILCPTCIDKETCVDCPVHSSLVVHCVMCNSADTKCVSHTGYATIVSDRATGLVCEKCELRCVCQICFMSDKQMESCAICGLCSCTSCTVFEPIDWSQYCVNKEVHPVLPINLCRLVSVCASCYPHVGLVPRNLPCRYCAMV